MAKPEDVERLRTRTRAFAVAIIRLCDSMPNKTGAQVVGRQLLQSGTSVGAQYREACRAKSNADFISKVEGCLQELEETAYWLEILVDAAILGSPAVAAIEGEARELNAIFTTIARRVKAKQS